MLSEIWKLVLLYLTICSYRLAKVYRTIFSQFYVLSTAFLLSPLRSQNLDHFVLAFLHLQNLFIGWCNP